MDARFYYEKDGREWAIQESGKMPVCFWTATKRDAEDAVSILNDLSNKGKQEQ